MAITDDERAEWQHLRDMKAWRSPRFMELDRKIATAAGDAARKLDVFGVTPEAEQASGFRW